MPLAKWGLHLALLYLYGFVVLEELAYTISVYLGQRLLRHLILYTSFIILGGILFRLGCPLVGVFYVQQVTIIACWSIISWMPNFFCLIHFAGSLYYYFFKNELRFPFVIVHCSELCLKYLSKKTFLFSHSKRLTFKLIQPTLQDLRPSFRIFVTFL